MTTEQRERRPRSTTARGRAQEEQALSYLRAQGLQLVERNFRCRLGELDLIMLDGKQLVFIEVRSRASGSRYGSPAESVNAAKQRRLINAAQRYLQMREREPPACRFDVVGISGSGSKQRLDWIKNAFST